jgi:hypothetical protein
VRIDGSGFAFNVLNRPCTVFGASPDLTRWLRGHWDFPARALNRDGIRIGVRCSRHIRHNAQGAPVTLHTSLGDIRLPWRALNRRMWGTGSSIRGVQLFLHPPSVDIDVWCLPHGAIDRRVACAMHVALSEAMRTSGLIPLHAAVIANQGRAIALTGVSGAGKSTLLLRALEHGWAPVCDDFAWLDPVDGRVFGFDRGIRLAPAALDAVHGAKRGPWIAAGDGKLLLRYEHATVPRVESAVLIQLVELHRDNTRASRWDCMTPRDAVRTWYESTGVAMCTQNRERLSAALSPLIASVETERLTLGHSLPAFVAL